jgi:predicted dehydrogenase
MGSHILDIARFLFGEAEVLFCQTSRVHRDIRGEDVATVLMRMVSGTTVVCNISYASRTEHEAFPQTFILVEGEKGSLELASDYWIRLTTEAGTHSKRYPPPRFDWSDPVEDVVHSSIVPCNANLLAGLRGEGQAETTGDDNLKTLELIFAAYDSARTGEAVRLR